MVAGLRERDGEPIGERVIVTGRVLDGAGEPVPDALLELWQVDASGRAVQQQGSLRRTPGAESVFTGRGRAATDPEDRYASTTVAPDAAFFSLVVFARGRRATPIARREADGYGFDVRLQGDDETVFLDLARGPATLSR